jgi:hypothetical protein
MPEIKHNFTGGKMEKDLDERLIPNGQYKDAMNIQVSTSEGSDVGTVQNILGNSIVPGQEFIRDNAFCVGSVSDEKNDKLYYFIYSKSENLLVNGDFSDSLATPINFPIAKSVEKHNYGGSLTDVFGNWIFWPEGNDGYDMGASGGVTPDFWGEFFHYRCCCG